MRLYSKWENAQTAKSFYRWQVYIRASQKTAEIMYSTRETFVNLSLTGNTVDRHIEVMSWHLQKSCIKKKLNRL